MVLIVSVTNTPPCTGDADGPGGQPLRACRDGQDRVGEGAGRALRAAGAGVQLR